MIFPLSLYDISLWLAAIAIILLITSELIYSSSEYSSRVVLDKKFLRVVSICCGLAFVVMVVMHIVHIY